MINKTLKKLITFTPRHIEMMEAIAAQSGWDQPTEIVKRGLEELYIKYFPAYKTNKPTGDTEEAIIKTAVIRAKAKAAAIKTEEDLYEQEKVTMCEELFNGVAEERSDGVKICRFTQYTLRGDTEINMPLSQVGPTTANNMLFIPSKEAIFRNRKEVEKLFNKLAK